MSDKEHQFEDAIIDDNDADENSDVEVVIDSAADDESEEDQDIRNNDDDDDDEEEQVEVVTVGDSGYNPSESSRAENQMEEEEEEEYQSALQSSRAGLTTTAAVTSDHDHDNDGGEEKEEEEGIQEADDDSGYNPSESSRVDVTDDYNNIPSENQQQQQQTSNYQDSDTQATQYGDSVAGDTLASLATATVQRQEEEGTSDGGGGGSMVVIDTSEVMMFPPEEEQEGEEEDSQAVEEEEEEHEEKVAEVMEVVEEDEETSGDDNDHVTKDDVPLTQETEEEADLKAAAVEAQVITEGDNTEAQPQPQAQEDNEEEEDSMKEVEVTSPSKETPQQEEASTPKLKAAQQSLPMQINNPVTPSSSAPSSIPKAPPPTPAEPRHLVTNTSITESAKKAVNTTAMAQLEALQQHADAASAAEQQQPPPPQGITPMDVDVDVEITTTTSSSEQQPPPPKLHESAMNASLTLNQSAVLSQLETDYNTLQTERDNQIQINSNQSNRIQELQSTLNNLQSNWQVGKENLLKKDALLMEEKEKRVLLLEEKKRDNERTDRLSAEGDILREEISRLSNTNQSLTNSLNHIQTSTKLSTTSSIPLKFENTRLQTELTSLEAHSQYLQSELNTTKEQLSSTKSTHRSEVQLLKTQLLSTQSELDGNVAHLHSTQSRNAQLESELQSKSQELLFAKSQLSDENEKSQLELEAERKLTSLHVRNNESLQDENNGLRRELKTLTQMAKEAADDNQMEQDEIMDEGKSLLEEQAEEYQTKIEALEDTNKNLEQELHRRVTIRSSSSRRAITNTTTGQSTSIVSINDQSTPPMGVSDLLDKLADAEDELASERIERKRTELYMQRIVTDIEGKTPLMKQQRKERDLAISGQELSRAKLSECQKDLNHYKRLVEEYQTDKSFLEREVQDHQKESEDLARQVQALLRAASSDHPTQPPNNNSGSMDVVEFGGIDELQTQNQNLLREHRRLTSRVSELEHDMEQNSMQNTLSNTLDELNVLKEERERQHKLVTDIVQQRDLYRLLLAKHDKTLLEHDDGGGDHGGESNNAIVAISSPTHTQLTRITNLEEMLSKSQANLLSAQHKNESLSERLIRCEKLTSELTTSLDKIRSDWLDASAKHARAEAECMYLNGRISRLEEGLESGKAELEHALNGKKEVEGRNGDLERVLEESRSDCTKHEMDVRQMQAKLRLVETKLQNATGSEVRLNAENQSLRSEVSRQHSLLDSIQKIEATLSSRTTEDQLQQQQEVTRLTRLLSTETNRYDTDRERWMGKLSDMETRLEVATQDKLKAVGELALIDLELKELKSNSTEQDVELRAVKERCAHLQKELEEPSSKKNEDEDTDTIRLDLEASRADLTQARERVSIYQSVAKSNEDALIELTKASDLYKSETQSKIKRMEGEVTTWQNACEAKGAELDGVKGDLAKQKQDQDAALAKLRGNVEEMSNDLERVTKEKDMASAKSQGMEEDLLTQRANAVSATNNYERELSLHASARTELRQARTDVEQATKSRQTAENNLSALQLQLNGERTQWNEERIKLQTSIKEAEDRLSQSKSQNELLHSQVATLSNMVDRIKNEKMDSLSTDDAAATTMAGTEESITLQKTITELREVVRFMRSEREALDAQMDALKRTTERERASNAITKRSLDEARAELVVLQQSINSPNNSAAVVQEIVEKTRQNEEQITLLRESNALLREETDRANVQLKEAGVELKKSMIDLEPMEKQINDVKFENAALEAEKASLSREVEAWKGRVQSLVSQFHPIDPDEHATALSNVEKLKKEISSIQTVKNKAEQESKNAKAIVSRLNKEISNQKSNFDRINKSLSRTISEKASLFKSNSDAQKTFERDRDDLKKSTKERETEIASLKTDLESTKGRVTNLTTMLRRHKKAAEDMKKQHQQALSKEQDAIRVLKTTMKKQEVTLKEQQVKAQKQGLAGRSTSPVNVAPSAASANASSGAVSAAAATAVAQPSTAAASIPEIPPGGFNFSASKTESSSGLDTKEEAKSSSGDNNTHTTGTAAPTESFKSVDKSTNQAVSESASTPKSLSTDSVAPSKDATTTDVDAPTASTGMDVGKDTNKQAAAESETQPSAASSETESSGHNAPPTKEQNELSLRSKLMHKKRMLAAALAKGKTPESTQKQTPSAATADSSLTATTTTASDPDTTVKKETVSAKDGGNTVITQKPPSTDPFTISHKRKLAPTSPTKPRSVTPFGAAKGTNTTPLPPFGSAAVAASKSSNAVPTFGSASKFSSTGFGSASSVTKSVSSTTAATTFGGGTILNLAPPSSSAKPFMFGSSPNIKLPLPSKKSAIGVGQQGGPGSVPFGLMRAGSSGAGGDASVSGSPSRFGSMTGAKPLFGDSSTTTKKRSLTGEESGMVVKQARMDESSLVAKEEGKVDGILVGNKKDGKEQAGGEKEDGKKGDNA